MIEKFKCATGFDRLALVTYTHTYRTRTRRCLFFVTLVFLDLFFFFFWSCVLSPFAGPLNHHGDLFMLSSYTVFFLLLSVWIPFKFNLMKWYLMFVIMKYFNLFKCVDRMWNWEYWAISSISIRAWHFYLDASFFFRLIWSGPIIYFGDKLTSMRYEA